ncbi:hypothetical protein CLOM_g675 [Closterium sp. NIES-68]|nr:hypothetical protein CLOM_g675 [Closterium sp. NIES-68]GJP69409.1 hypothetical protein CLOP_g339 [Closterium sp. NIES-67]
MTASLERPCRTTIGLLRARVAVLLVALLLTAAFPPATSMIGASQESAGVSPSVYIVTLRSAQPVLSYRGGIPGIPPTAPPLLSSAVKAARNGMRNFFRSRHFRPRPQLRTSAAQKLSAFLRQQQRYVAESVGVSRKNILHSYRYLRHGFAARLSPTQARRLARHPAVARVRASVRLYPATTHSPAFLKLPASLWNASGGAEGEGAGEGVVIGVIDSGIWPEHPSFSNPARTFGGPPPGWAGTCEDTGDFEAASACGEKIVGARSFWGAVAQSEGEIDLTSDFMSPRDSKGHGSWCAGAAAGNGGVQVTASNGQSLGLASGMAPRARLAVYKVLWRLTGGEDVAALADVQAAVEQAVLDGVDVISISLAGIYENSDYFDDVDYLNAIKAGVVIVVAAGNAGRPPSEWSYRTLSNFSPYYLTVGACSIGRRYTTDVTLSSGVTVTGAGMGGNKDTAAGLPIILGRNGLLPNHDNIEGDYCYPTSLDPSRVAGKIVVCINGKARVWEKVREVVGAGGLAMVLVNDPQGEPYLRDNYDSSIPIVHLSAADGSKLRRAMKALKNPTAVFPESFTVATVPEAPVIASFSSTGPVQVPSITPSHALPTNDILKPDLVAPGLSLWSAAVGSMDDPGVVRFGLASGTSMATPHVAGVAALLVQRNPTWSPAQVMSAMLTSAATTNDAGKPIKLESGVTATPWEMGAGMINPPGMLDPGLTYNMDSQDLLNFLAGQNVSAAVKLFNAGPLSAIPAYNLNRPSISVSRLTGTVMVARTVTNVAGVPSTYRATVVAPTGVKVVVTPSSFTIEKDASIPYTVTLSVTRSSAGRFAFGSITWVDDLGHSVRSVIAVQPLKALRRK